jgi:uncharacterized membrane-anchored protein YhcB (DUF1043 family)
MSETILIVLGAIGLLAAGGGLGFWLAQWRMRSESSKADEVQQQFDDYRREVTQHFGQTAEHFKAIGREYRELYEHMAGGADSLCDRDALDTKLSFEPKAILESIAEEQEPQAPQDFAEEDQPADTAPVSPDEPITAPVSPDEPITAEPDKEPAETLAPDAEAEDGDKAGRILH